MRTSQGGGAQGEDWGIWQESSPSESHRTRLITPSNDCDGVCAILLTRETH